MFRDVNYYLSFLLLSLHYYLCISARSLFEALGWDVYHKQECRADKREVKEEDAVDVEGKIKNPDYSFRLFDKRKFFVEVKRPSINIESGVYPAYQITRYAWSADLAISILTDFEEFSVYYCRARPSKDDKSTKSRLLYFRYDQYAEKWPEIAALFSRADSKCSGSSFPRFSALLNIPAHAFALK